MQSSSPRYHATICTEEQSPDEIDALFILRKKLFVDEHGWDLTVHDGRERDQFDTAETVHCLLYRDQQLIGGFRAIRTDRDYLVRSVFPELASFRPFPQRWDAWEISRFGIVPVGNRLQAAKINYSLMLRFAQVRGATALVALADLGYERFLRMLGIRTRRYGPPRVIGHDRHGAPIEVVAGEIPIFEQDDKRFHDLVALAKQVEINDAAHVLGRSRIPA